MVVSSAEQILTVGVEIGRHRDRAKRHDPAERLKDAAEERVRNRRERQHIEPPRLVVTHPDQRRCTVRRDRPGIEPRRSRHEPKLVLRNPRWYGPAEAIDRRRTERWRLRASGGLVGERRTSRREHRACDRGDASFRLVQFDDPMLCRARRANKAGVQLIVAASHWRTKIGRQRQRIAGAFGMIEDRPQHRRRGDAAERTDERPVVIARCSGTRSIRSRRTFVARSNGCAGPGGPCATELSKLSIDISISVTGDALTIVSVR